MTEREVLDEEELEELEAALAEVEAALIEGDLETARAALDEAREIAGDDDPDVAYGRALIAWESGDLDSAASELRQVLEEDPEFADAHHTLGLVLEELGDEAGKVHHFLRAHALDEKHEREEAVSTPKDVDRIEAIARDVIEGLPDPFGEKLASVPVILEQRPTKNLVEEGHDPRAFGFFDGAPNGTTDVPAPTRIVLYTSNLLSAFAADDLEEQIEITVLHEIGHYFGLDEEDMARLGLE